MYIVVKIMMTGVVKKFLSADAPEVAASWQLPALPMKVAFVLVFFMFSATAFRTGHHLQPHTFKGQKSSSGFRRLLHSGPQAFPQKPTSWRHPSKSEPGLTALELSASKEAEAVHGSSTTLAENDDEDWIPAQTASFEERVSPKHVKTKKPHYEHPKYEHPL